MRFSRVFTIIVAAFALLAVGLWKIGPDWRTLLSNPPMNTDVLFWNQAQRDAGFRMLDRLPVLVKARRISANSAVREFASGEPFAFDFDSDQYFEQNRHSGVVILHNGALRYEKYGLDFDANGRWTSFSVGKSFTSTLVGAAIKDGYIKSLNDPVTDYIPALSTSPYKDVSIRQLLTMTSGVAWNEDYDDPASDVALFNKHKAEDGLPTIVSYMRARSRAHPAGEVWHYSTGETNLIGVLVSEATGKNLSDYLTEKIWGPYGMEADATWLLGKDGKEISGCCIQATTRDFARFGQFFLDDAIVNGERVVPDGWVTQATSAQVTTTIPVRTRYGFQWWVYEDGAYAASGIFGQGIFIDPARNLVIAHNSSWQSALGDSTGEVRAREEFFRAVQATIDREGQS